MRFPDLHPILPELIMTAMGLTLLLIELVIKKKESIAFITLIGTLIALYFLKTTSGVTFNGMFISDSYSLFFKVVFFVNLILSILISIRYLKIEQSLHGEYYSLLVLSTIGMMIMASAGDLIVLYLGLELMALSTYILAGFVRHEKRSSEAAVKYFLMGAFSSAILLYGISMVYGLTGTTDINDIARYISSNGISDNHLLLFSVVLFIVAFGFKIAAAPFHMWAPDVYEGAPTSITAFMSVGPKAAGFSVFGRVFIIAFQMLQADWAAALIPISILTMAIGNIIALAQTNIKRMLAYSSIAHAGYALLALIPGTSEGISSMMNYLLIYAFMNIGAFSIVIMMRSEGFRGEDISDYNGLAKKHPFISAIMLVFMFSLTGIPPTAGFIGKFYIFTALINSGHIGLVLIAVFFSVVSAFYYLRIVVNMYMKEPEAEITLSTTPSIGLAACFSVLMVILIGIFPQPIIEFARSTLLSI